MPRNDGILNAYDWQVGDCFKCARTRIASTPLGAIVTELGDHYEIHACRACVLQLEAEARRQAERDGRAYKPGQLGCSEA